MRHLKTGTRPGLALALVLFASPPAHGAPGDGSLGRVRLPTSCAAEVRDELDSAVALLHHMTYRRAREGFLRVAAADPGCAMAQWGVAMTLFQPLWPNRPGAAELRGGQEAVERARALGPPTERERLYVAAVAAFFADSASTDHWQRIRRWEAAQEALHRAFPDDPDAAAFFALAHLAAAPLAERPLDHHERAAALLLALHGALPTHPGALHYLIHANDVTGREGLSLDVVRSYGEIAPHNPHALHMLTHIFVRLGSWQEAIDWNRKAAAAALDHPEGEHGEHVSDEFPHTLEYLVYAALQQGDFATATDAWHRVRRTASLQPTFKTAFHLASIPARIALEGHAWAEAASLPLREPAQVQWDRFPWPEAITRFARGLGSARGGDVGAARDAVAALAGLRDRALEAGEEGFAREIELLRLELAAWVAHGDGDAAAALALMGSAVELEATTPKQAVTPAPTLPAEELLGDLLLELGHPTAALAAYEAALRSWPARRNSLAGAEAARKRLDASPAAPGTLP
jgi:tetratricopeptide (TPR) repeat protein